MSQKTNQQIALEVIAGKWGNGDERIKRLWDAGYNPTAVQSIVNSLLMGDTGTGDKNVMKLGTKTMTIDVDLTVYGSLSLNLHFGDSNG